MNTPAPFAGREIVFHDLAYKIAMDGRGWIGHFRIFRCVLTYSTLGRATMENTCSRALPEVTHSVLWQVKSRTTQAMSLRRLAFLMKPARKVRYVAVSISARHPLVSLYPVNLSRRSD